MRQALSLMIVGVVLASVVIPVSAQGSEDICVTVIVATIQQAGLDPQVSAPVFGCAQDERGLWYMRKVASTRSEHYRLDPLDARGRSLLQLVDSMSMHQAFQGAVQFDRSSSTLYTVGPGNVMNKSDISDQAVGSAPNWLNNYTSIYSQAMQGFLTRIAGQVPDLVEYMQWFMARRDATLTSMAGGINPMAGTAFLANWGYQQFPWFWQLSDQVAIAEYIGTNAQLDVPTVSSQTDSSNSASPVILEIEFIDRDMNRVADVCVTVYQMIPESEIVVVCDNQGRDLFPIEGVIRMNVIPGRYNVTVNQAPEGFLVGPGNNWVIDVTEEGGKRVIKSE